MTIENALASVEVVLLTSPGDFRKARTLIRPGELKVRKAQAGRVMLTLERVDDYEVVVIE